METCLSISSAAGILLRRRLPPVRRCELTKRVARLYEQNAPLEEIRRGVEQYVQRWKRWVSSGVQDVSDTFTWPGVFLEHTVSLLETHRTSA